MTTLPFMRRKLVAAAASTLLCVTAASAANTGALADAQARYRQDLAVCKSGQSNQDAATCRREAKNALAEARRGGLSDAPGQYQQNALQRCSVQKDGDRTACEARILAEGNVDAGVAAGGLLRESVTVTPVK